MREVESSNIRAVGHDAASNVLRVQFKGGKDGKPGKVYDYANVGAALFERFRTSNSHGRFLNENIKSSPSLYPYTEVPAAA